METIAPGVHQLSLGANGFLVDGDEGVTLVDTGIPGRAGAIADGLARLRRGWDDLTAIVVTHAHADHVGSAAEVLTRARGASLAMSPQGAAAARGDRSAGLPPRLERLGWLGDLMFRAVPSAQHVDVDHEVTEAGGVLPTDMSVVETPGHTPGHVSFLLDRAGGICFVGDAANATRGGRVTRGWMNASTPTLDASIRHLAEQDFEVACFGHAPPIVAAADGAFRALADDLD